MTRMRVLVVGSGGREHALVWQLMRSPSVAEVAAAPGNAGIGQVARCYPVAADQIDAIVALAVQESFDLVVVGPEAPLAAGLADALTARGIATFGCSRAAAAIEASKQFAKTLMQHAGVPTARSFALSRLPTLAELTEQARALGSERLVVKADGLAAGKGVIVCDDINAAWQAIATLIDGQLVGAAGAQVLVEECLVGREASCMALVDGRSFALLDACEDHKSVHDNDSGPMTGGMGAICPTPVVDEEVRRRVERDVFARIVPALAEAGRPFRGLLYAGLMLTQDGPRVLEFNCRFGDPETQPLLMRLDDDLGALLYRVARGELPPPPRFRPESACCIVLCAAGYPGAYRRGDRIVGVERAVALADVQVFHAGTRNQDGELVTAGGRVLGVTALGSDLAAARKRAYEAAAQIHFEGIHYRSDIGARAGSSAVA